MRAYFTNTNFMWIDQTLFQSVLLFYPEVYFPMDTSELNWSPLDRIMREAEKKEWPEDIVNLVPENKDNELVKSALKRYLDRNPATYKKLKSRLLDVRFIGDKMESFYKECFEIPLQSDSATDHQICFYRPDGSVGNQSTHASVLIYSSIECDRFAHVFSRFGCIVERR